MVMEKLGLLIVEVEIGVAVVVVAVVVVILLFDFFFQAEDGIRDFCLSRGLGDVYKRQG